MLIPKPFSWSIAQAWLLAGSVLLLGGCATQYPSTQYPSSSASSSEYALASDTATPIENPDLNGFLEQAPAGGVLTLSVSPWGENVDIIADEAYFAASGRACRKLRIVSGYDTMQKALVCKSANGWVKQRSVTQMSKGHS